MARSSSTWKNPGPVAYVWTSCASMSRYTRVDPALSIATSGACRASTPISPAAPGTTIISASPSNAGPSGVTTETENFGCCAIRGSLAARQLLAALDRLLDRADHVERLLQQVVVHAVEDLGEAADRVIELHVLPRGARELLGHEVRLREEPLDLAGTRNDELVLVGELVDTEDGDDVLQVAIALQRFLHPCRAPVVLVGDDARLQGARGRVERIDRRIDALLDDGPREHRRRVEMRKRVRRRRIREVVRRHVDGLHRRDRAGARRRDSLLQLPHLRRESRLVADGARHAAEEGRHLGARLDEPEDVVDEEQHVLPLIAEVLRHRQAGQTDAQARSRRLVHLPVDHRDLGENACLLHLDVEVGAFARALADTGEDGHAAVLHRDVVDQLLDEHRLADARAAEEPDLAAADVRRDQIDDLQPGLEDLHLRRELAEGRRVAVDRPPLAGRFLLAVDGIADHVPDPAEGNVADRDGDGPPRVDDLDAARKAVGGVHRDGAHAVVAQVLLHLRDQLARAAVLGHLDAQRVVDLRQPAREDGVEDDALDLDDPAGALLGLRSGHASPYAVRASAPATTSRISWVISAWRARFICRV